MSIEGNTVRCGSVTGISLAEVPECRIEGNRIITTEPRMNRILNEPVVIGGAIRAVLLAAMAFGFEVTNEQLGAVMLAVEAVLALVTRALVTPNQLAESRVGTAILDGQAVTPTTATTPR